MDRDRPVFAAGLGGFGGAQLIEKRKKFNRDGRRLRLADKRRREEDGEAIADPRRYS